MQRKKTELSRLQSKLLCLCKTIKLYFGFWDYSFFLFVEYVVSSTEDESYINAQKGYNSRVKSEILQKLKAIE